MKLHKFFVAAAVTLAASSLLAQTAPAGAAVATTSGIGAVFTPTIVATTFVVVVAIVASKGTSGTN